MLLNMSLKKEANLIISHEALFGIIGRSSKNGIEESKKIMKCLFRKKRKITKSKDILKVKYFDY